jgi:4-amino-4-deoxy-L-arabinose transferase-like glycosyltransferase
VRPGGADRLQDSRVWTLVVSWARRLAMAPPKVWAGIVGGLALLVRLPFFFDPHPTIQPDSTGYLSIANSVVHGNGFGDLGLLRPPGYPLFIVLVRLLPGSTVDGLVVVQHLLGVALAVTILLITWRFFGKPAAITAGLLAAISPQLISVEHEILSDYLFGLFLFAGTVTLALGVRRRSMWLYCATGVLFGLATETKPLGQVLVFIAPIVLILALRRWKPALVGTLIVTLSMAALVVPWVIRNEVQYGHPVLSTISDQVVFWRVFDAQRPLPFVGHDADTQLVRRLYASSSVKAPVTVWNALHELIVVRRYSDYEAGQRQRAIAMRSIYAYPADFARQSIDYFREFATTPGPTTGYDTIQQLRSTYSRSIDATPAIIGSVSWPAIRIAPWLTVLWWLLSGFGLAGLVLLRSRNESQRIAMTTFVATWVIVGAGTALTGLPALRYNVVGLPFLLIIGSAGLVIVVNAIKRWTTAGDSASTRKGAESVA